MKIHATILFFYSTVEHKGRIQHTTSLGGDMQALLMCANAIGSPSFLLR